MRPVNQTAEVEGLITRYTYLDIWAPRQLLSLSIYWPDNQIYLDISVYIWIYLDIWAPRQLLSLCPYIDLESGRYQMAWRGGGEGGGNYNGSKTMLQLPASAVDPHSF